MHKYYINVVVLSMHMSWNGDISCDCTQKDYISSNLNLEVEQFYVLVPRECRTHHTNWTHYVL